MTLSSSKTSPRFLIILLPSSLIDRSLSLCHQKKLLSSALGTSAEPKDKNTAKVSSENGNEIFTALLVCHEQIEQQKHRRTSSGGPISSIETSMWTDLAATIVTDTSKPNFHSSVCGFESKLNKNIYNRTIVWHYCGINAYTFKDLQRLVVRILHLSI